MFVMKLLSERKKPNGTIVYRISTQVTEFRLLSDNRKLLKLSVIGGPNRVVSLCWDATTNVGLLSTSTGEIFLLF